MRHRILLALPLAFALICSQKCQADLIVEFEQNFEMQSGVTGMNNTSSIDVFVRHSTSSVEIGEFSLQFAVSAPASGAGVLSFADPQSSSERAESNYVLFVFGGTLGSFNTTLQNSDTGLIQSDGLPDSLSAGGTVTVGTTQSLLATLELVHQSASDSGVDADFQISLVEGPITFFQRYDTPGVPVPTSTLIDAVSYTNTGDVSISAVPEPSSFCLLAGAGLVGLMRRRRKTA